MLLRRIQGRIQFTLETRFRCTYLRTPKVALALVMGGCWVATFLVAPNRLGRNLLRAYTLLHGSETPPGAMWDAWSCLGGQALPSPLKICLALGDLAGRLPSPDERTGTFHQVAEKGVVVQTYWA